MPYASLLIYPGLGLRACWGWGCFPDQWLNASTSSKSADSLSTSPREPYTSCLNFQHKKKKKQLTGFAVASPQSSLNTDLKATDRRSKYCIKNSTHTCHMTIKNNPLETYMWLLSILICYAHFYMYNEKYKKAWV